jgi:hypothetical protein
VTTKAEQVDRRADNSAWMENAVRLGLVSYGVVHLVLAWLALKLAFGDKGASASNQGALHQLARNSVGRVSLYVVAVGFVALAIWQLLEAAGGHRTDEGATRLGKRLASVGKLVIYGALAVTAFKTAIGAGSGGEHTTGLTAQLMSLPAGPLIVGAVGVAIMAIGGGLLYRGVSEGFRDKLEPEGATGADGRAYAWLGKTGYVTKGLAIGVVGSLFVYAALTHDPHKSGGLDQALHKLLGTPFGAPLLVVIAVGFACFGLFCFAWARHVDT